MKAFSRRHCRICLYCIKHILKTQPQRNAALCYRATPYVLFRLGIPIVLRKDFSITHGELKPTVPEQSASRFHIFNSDLAFHFASSFSNLSCGLSSSSSISISTISSFSSSASSTCGLFLRFASSISVSPVSPSSSSLASAEAS